MAELNDFDAIGANELVPKLLGPVSESAGKTLQDLWELIFGGFGNYVERKREIRKRALLEFKESLERKVNSIPSDQICEPSLSIIGPTLEASKYCFEEVKIREMFASVISASMDSATATHIHPSFPTIIRQMSTCDAQNLECLHTSEGMLPVCEYQIKLVDDDDEGKDFLLIKPCRTIYTNVFLSNPHIASIEKNAISLSSLSRLGLVGLNFDVSIHDEDYSLFEKTAEYTEILQQYSGRIGEIPYIQHGSVKLTPLGIDLCTICFSETNP